MIRFGIRFSAQLRLPQIVTKSINQLKELYTYLKPKMSNK